MKLQSVFPEALRQYFHDTPGIVLVLKADHKVIGKPYQEAIPTHPRLRFGLEPDIQYMVEIDVGQQGANDSPNAKGNQAVLCCLTVLLATRARRQECNVGS